MEKIFRENAQLAREIASEGIILLKNDNHFLPLSHGTNIAVVGRGCFDLVASGGGSEVVNTFYRKSIFDGLKEKEKEGKISVYLPETKEYPTVDFPTKYLAIVANSRDTVVFSINRYSEESADRKPVKGEFYISDAEEQFLDDLKTAGIKNVILVLNVANQMDLSFIDRHPIIKSVLLCYLPGMEGGAAVADIICGDVTPSGKLADTFAGAYENYPTAETFNEYEHVIRYTEDVFVGYRYFETVPGAAEKVQYPFGFGLSYTTFAFDDISCESDGKKVTVSLSVRNTGKYSGKEVVQVYTHSPKGKLPKPAKELRAFAKTGLLAPGETQSVTLSFAVSDMASFDDSGVTGFLASYVLEKGNYEILVGNSVRNTVKCGTVKIDETVPTSRHKLELTPTLPTRMNAEGGEYRYVIGGKAEEKKPASAAETPATKYTLADVARGKITLNELIGCMSPEDMIHLAHGQPITIGMGTAGVGNLPRYGIPNVQTSDGAAGFKRDISTTTFPCSTLTACCFNTELWKKLGEARAKEGKAVDVDILLAPALNIHRDPLAGRNFEYYSEDPYLAGKVTATIVRYAEKNGLPTTIKHFAANNRERYRKECSSLVSERALREIYLKGFEIAVKEGHPSCVMTAYNLINGVYPSENPALLRDILRGEWGFDGVIMTDWWNLASMWREIKAGNNIRMPIAEIGECEKVLAKYEKGYITREELEENTAYVLKLIMKTYRFKKSIS